MKITFSYFQVLFLLASMLLSMLLSSFSWVSNPPREKKAPPSKTQRVQQRQQQRLLRLEKRLQRVERPAQRLRLEQRLRRLHQGEPKLWTWAAIGFSFSTLAFLLLLTLLAGGIGSLGGVILGFLALILLGILGLVFSIIGLVLPGVNERFGGRGLAIAGVALIGVVILIFILLTRI